MMATQDLRAVAEAEIAEAWQGMMDALAEYVRASGWEPSFREPHAIDVGLRESAEVRWASARVDALVNAELDRGRYDYRI